MIAALLLVLCLFFQSCTQEGRSAEILDVPTSGGEAGSTIYVINLNDSGLGSLRSATLRTVPRRIVFDVSGVIELESEILIDSPYITIYGLSAPSPGITLRNFGITVQTNDVIINHLRIYVGDEGKEDDPEPGNHDCITVHGGKRVVIDHCTLLWAIDETVSTWPRRATGSYPHDITFSNCIMAEALCNSIHPDGAHSMGPFIHESSQVTFVRNLIAHCKARTPKIGGGTSTILVNNVIYDPAWLFIEIENMDGNPVEPVSTIIGNVVIKGPSAEGHLKYAVWLNRMGEGARIYVRDNPCDLYVPGSEWSCVRSDLPDSVNVRVMEPPIWKKSINVYPSSEVENLVLSNAGARPHERDYHERRVIQQVRQRSGRIIDSQKDVEPQE